MSSDSLANHTQEEGPNDVFPLESEILALRDNPDFEAMVNIISKLEALKSKAITDITTLYDIKAQALEDPLAFVQRLQKHKEDLGIPVISKVPNLPHIDWSKYSGNAESTDTYLSKQLRNLRGVKISVPAELKTQSATSTASTSTAETVTVVRGRVKLEDKPETFNQLWTSDEQKRLEELLIEFPPERISSRRYRKIAEKLGTKTLQQVSSRVQKYFIKLAQSGLPVPGKVPNLSSYRKKKHRSNKYKHQFHLQSSMSSMMQAYVPPVYMDEESDEDTPRSRSMATSMNSSESESDEEVDIPVDLHQTDEYKELLMLKEIRRHKLEQTHESYKCDGCGQEPIRGVRWHCTECPEELSVDFCSACINHSITIGSHTPIHQMEASTKQEATVLPQRTDTFHDKDYLSSKFNIPGHYNYLDPNYMPHRGST